jgi:hypothetical protein
VRKIIILFLVFFSFSIIGCANETKEEETKEEETKEEETKEEETKEEETKYKGWINKSINYWITPSKHHAIKISTIPITNRICILADDDKINLNHINNWYFVEYRYKPFECSDSSDKYDSEWEYYFVSEYEIKRYNFIMRCTNPSDIIYTVN